MATVKMEKYSQSSALTPTKAADTTLKIAIIAKMTLLMGVIMVIVEAWLPKRGRLRISG